MHRILIAAVLATLSLAAADRAEALKPAPVVVELFTSEGCSSCPPADRLLIRLHEQQPFQDVELIVLSQHVDYWNRLGWTDPFSSKASTNRQHWYSMRWPTRIYTPQMVVDGQVEFVGSDGRRAAAVIEAAARRPKTMVAVRQGDVVEERLRVAVDVGPLPGKKSADVYLAVLEDGLETAVPRGENAGRSLPHTAVTRSLERVGSVKNGGAEGMIEIDPAWNQGRLRVVAFVQEKGSRRIVGAASAPLRGGSTVD